MTTQPEPEPQERDAPLERHVAEEEMRYPGHGHPDEVREDVGLEDDAGRDPDPEGAPLPPDADRSRPAPLGHDNE